MNIVETDKLVPKDVMTYKHGNKGSDGRGEDQSCSIHGMLVVESVEEVVQGIRPCNSKSQFISCHMICLQSFQAILSSLLGVPSRISTNLLHT